MFKKPPFSTLFRKDEAGPETDTFDSDAGSAPSVVPGLRREITFQRRQSERRENLEPNAPDVEARRALSADRTSRPAPGHAQLRATSSVPSEHPRYDILSAETLPSIGTNIEQVHKQLQDAANIEETLHAGIHFDNRSQYPAELPSDLEESSNASDDIRVLKEVEHRWILNLSMHHRDKSDREKFFITYVEEPNKWLRVTISCDYRACPHGSLEADLKSLYYQRDKSGKIYEALCESLSNIQFFSSVTNLKLQTDDGKLHVHVTEDVNEIIEYPEASLLHYLDCERFAESEVHFEGHESGFVYRVLIRNERYIKKEIPGPEAVEEFLYEINALSSLKPSAHVISLEGLVVDEDRERVKGLVLAFATDGALVDILYDHKEVSPIPWPRRLKWAIQIVEGLSDIHEAGFVQGDFTLSNIVIDGDDNAQIIDINRRGCPVGWEPPELRTMIEAGQKISIYIGVKTDMFQLGMVLWALAEGHDEPERVIRPLKRQLWKDVPEWYADVFEACYAEIPQTRPTAKEVLRKFEEGQRERVQQPDAVVHSLSDTHENLAILRDCQLTVPSAPIAEAQSSNPPQAISHPAAWHVPPHQDSGFDEM